jgi:hypothetical protein
MCWRGEGNGQPKKGVPMGTDDILANVDEDKITHVSASAAGMIARSEVEAQLDAAHKYKRSVTRFMAEAISLATISQEVAESCIYSVPRDGKMITGPSVRLAEICASAYGNLHVGGRVVEEEEKEIVAQGGAWDLEKNLRVTVESRRRITNKAGRRYSDDMVVTTGNAAVSIALRNAILRVIPRAYVDTIYAKVRLVAVGDAKTLVARRTEIVARLAKLGVTADRVLARLGKQGPDDVGVDDLEVLIGLGTAIKNNEMTIDDAFPAPMPAPAAPGDDGKRISLKAPKADAMREPGAD